MVPVSWYQVGGRVGGRDLSMAGLVGDLCAAVAWSGGFCFCGTSRRLRWRMLHRKEEVVVGDGARGHPADPHNQRSTAEV